ncbi:MAG: tRNA pseudouridine(55) synthase TruB [Christensenellales bacterium]
MHGIINVYKPTGMSSNFVLTCLKKQCDIKKVGHLGTLDPLACGVLPVMVNKGTKLFDFYLNKTKIYRSVFTFGKETDTLDAEGKIVAIKNYIPTEEVILKAIKQFEGEISQLPPNFSAKVIGGVKAYNLARQGKYFELQPKNVYVEYFKLVKQLTNNSFLFEIKCSSGTYIRSLARDLAKACDSCAFMSALIRIKAGEFDILTANYVKSLTKDNFIDKIVKIETLLKNLPKIDLDSKFYKQISNGVKISVTNANVKNCVVICNKQLIGLGEVKNGILSITTNLQN